MKVMVFMISTVIALWPYTVKTEVQKVTSGEYENCMTTLRSNDFSNLNCYGLWVILVAMSRIFV